MKTLLQINLCVNAYSTGKIVEQIGNEAQRRGWRSIVAYGYDVYHDNISSAASSNSETIFIGGKKNRSIHNLFYHVTGLKGCFSVISTIKLVRKISKLSPDVIHLHNIHDLYVNYPLLFRYLKKAGIPVVWTLHDCWAYTGGCYYYSMLKCDHWKSGCYKCKLHKNKQVFLNSRLNYILKKYYFESVPNISFVTVSEWLKNEISQSFLRNHSVYTIENGIEIDKFYKRQTDLRNRLSISNDTIVLVAVASSWTERKGLKDYLKLAEQLRINYRLILVGLSPDEYELPSSIIPIGRTTSITEMCDIYSIADIVLNLSHEETFGLTTVEGFACGKPSIVYNCTASPELITENTGVVVQEGDIEGVISAIEYIISNPNKVNFEKECRQRSEKYYNSNLNIARYVDLYDRVMLPKAEMES